MIGLARAILILGGKIYTYTHAHTIKGGREAKVHTTNGHIIRCNHIAVCTNSPVNNLINMIDKLQPQRTYAIAATIAKGSVEKALYWDMAEPYHYVRFVEGTDTDYIISGGEDHTVGYNNAEDTAARFARLEEWTRLRWPVGTLTNRWSGQVLEPCDLLAYTGRNPHDHPNVYIHTGDSGTGVTYAALAGMIIRDLITGRENKYAGLYDPARKAVKSWPEYIAHATQMQAGYTKWLQPGDISDIEELPRCSGAIIREGFTLQPVAVYKDEEGRVYKMSASCTHMKGIVHWNPAEKSWDCPVHGSRFDAYGHVIMGPANERLSSIHDPTSPPNQRIPPCAMHISHPQFIDKNINESNRIDPNYLSPQNFTTINTKAESGPSVQTFISGQTKL